MGGVQQVPLVSGEEAWGQKGEGTDQVVPLVGREGEDLLHQQLTQMLVQLPELLLPSLAVREEEELFGQLVQQMTRIQQYLQLISLLVHEPVHVCDAYECEKG